MCGQHKQPHAEIGFSRGCATHEIFLFFRLLYFLIFIPFPKVFLNLNFLATPARLLWPNNFVTPHAASVAVLSFHASLVPHHWCWCLVFKNTFGKDLLLKLKKKSKNKKKLSTAWKNRYFHRPFRANDDPTTWRNRFWPHGKMSFLVVHLIKITFKI